MQRYIALKVLNAVLVDRHARGSNPLEPLEDALRAGDSLIFFPEGTRGLERLPDRFKGGLYHLAREFPDVEFVPVYLDNLRRALPKGSLIPVPISCVARFGCPIALASGEAKPLFLERARAAVETPRMIQLPTVEPMMLWLYAGVLGLLIVASLVGFVLARA